MIAQLVAFALLGSASVGARPGAVEIDLNVKDGDTIAGEVQFKVTVKADSAVNQVEYYVGDDLRDTDSSTPYEFKLDTLDANQPEGEIKLTFAAYTTEGESAKKILKLKIDNGLAKGCEFYVSQGTDFVVNSKFDEALLSGRKALKAKPGDNAARLLMARAYLGKGVLDSAQRYAEDVAAADPKDYGAQELLSGINLRRAFTTFNRGGDKAEILKSISVALKAAVEARKKALETRVDVFGTVTPENLTKYADVCIAAGRYSAAISALAPVFRKDERQTAVANRLIYSQMRAGRYKDSGESLAAYGKRGQMDAYGFALLAIQRAMDGEEELSDEAMKEAILNDSQDLGVRTAQAYIALKRGKVNVLSKIAEELGKDSSERPEVNYYLASVFNSLNRYEEGTARFERAVLAEPMYYDVYVARGNDALAIAVKGRVKKEEIAFQYDVAKMFYETALVARPESVEALTGLALVNGFLKKDADCVKFAQAAIAAGPSYPAAYYTLALALSNVEATVRASAMVAEREQRREDAKELYAQAGKLHRDAYAAKDKAGEFDKAYLQGMGLTPTVADAYNYFAKHGKLPLLTPPTN
jgi:tetratricopeptide (TPR) repeat protein